MQWKIFRPCLVLFVVATGPLALAAVAQEPAEPQVIEIDIGKAGGSTVQFGKPQSAVSQGGVEVGQPTTISVAVDNREVLGIFVEQRIGDSIINNERERDPRSKGEAKIVGGSGTTRTIEFTPWQVGNLDLFVCISYADGGVAVQPRSLHVSPTAKGLTRFSLNDGFSVMPIVLGAEEMKSKGWLFPEATYSTLKYPVRLHDSSEIRLTVQQSVTEPVVRVDSNGQIYGLRPGKAVVTGSFGGLTSRVTVMVYSKENDPQTRWLTKAK
jgi:hypothetical protein